VLRIRTVRILIVFQDLDLLATLMSTTKLTRRENLTKYAFWLVLLDLLIRKIK
jgi:hypothetical protein